MTVLSEIFTVEPGWEQLVEIFGEPHDDTRPIPNQRGQAVMVTRAQFDEWTMNLRISYVTSQIDLSELVNLVDIGGSLVGIGSWRKENKGPMGRFTVVGESDG